MWDPCAKPRCLPELPVLANFAMVHLVSNDIVNEFCKIFLLRLRINVVRGFNRAASFCSYSKLGPAICTMF